MILSRHQYKDLYPVSPDDEYLILGTLHPHRTERFIVPFFYGNKNSIWNILDSAFDGRYALNNLPNILLFLRQNRIWVSDMVAESRRPSESSTRDDEMTDIVFNTDQIGSGIRNSRIHTILFTGGFGKNGAATLFVQAFGLKKPEIVQREFRLETSLFGRSIRCVLLYSPSGQANVGIVRSPEYKAQADVYASYQHPVARFRIDRYREIFNFVK